jgi:hypothetical protein
MSSKGWRRNSARTVPRRFAGTARFIERGSRRGALHIYTPSRAEAAGGVRSRALHFVNAGRGSACRSGCCTFKRADPDAGSPTRARHTPAIASTRMAVTKRRARAAPRRLPLHRWRLRSAERAPRPGDCPCTDGVYEAQSARRAPAAASARTAFTKRRARAAPGDCLCTDSVYEVQSARRAPATASARTAFVTRSPNSAKNPFFRRRPSPLRPRQN